MSCSHAHIDPTLFLVVCENGMKKAKCPLCGRFLGYVPELPSESTPKKRITKVARNDASSQNLPLQ